MLHFANASINPLRSMQNSNKKNAENKAEIQLKNIENGIFGIQEQKWWENKRLENQMQLRLQNTNFIEHSVEPIAVCLNAFVKAAPEWWLCLHQVMILTEVWHRISKCWFTCVYPSQIMSTSSVMNTGVAVRNNDMMNLRQKKRLGSTVLNDTKATNNQRGAR